MMRRKMIQKKATTEELPESRRGFKKAYLEVLRIIAIFFVVFNHTWTKGFFMFMTVTDSKWKCGVYLFFSILCKIGVPLFFMISGAVLLVRKETIRKLYFKRVLRIVLVIILFSFWMYWIQQEAQGGQIYLEDFFLKIYTSNIIDPYWYLYAYLGILVCLPFLRSMVQRMNHQNYYYLIIMFTLLMNVIPIFEYVTFMGQYSLNPAIKIPILTTQSFFFFLLGHFCDNKLDIDCISYKKIGVLAVASIVCIVAMVHLTFIRMEFIRQPSFFKVQKFFTFFTAIPTITIFLFVKKRFQTTRHQRAANRILMFIGSTVFGVYLIHIELRNIFFDSIFETTIKYIDPMAASWVSVLAIILMSFCIVCILKCVPGVKKII